MSTFFSFAWHLFQFNVNTAIWSDYNPIDGTFEALANYTISYHQDSIQPTSQRLVRYDDQWSVIRKPTHLPTHRPTNYPTKYPTSTPTISPTLIPTHSPSPSPTLHPTNRPTKYPTTPKPTGAPTENEDEMLDHLIAKKQSCKQQLVKLYTVHSSFMDELEKELMEKRDADALIVRNALHAFNQQKDSSFKMKGYFTLIDDAFQRLQVPLRAMTSLNIMFESRFREFTKETVSIITSLPDDVFNKVCGFVREAFGAIDQDHPLLAYLMHQKYKKSDKTVSPLLSPFVGKPSEYAIIADMVFSAFLEVLNSKILNLMHVLKHSEFARSSMFPPQLIAAWTYFSSKTQNSMDVIIPKLYTHILHCINKNITSEEIKEYQRMVEEILFHSELIANFKSSVDISKILYDWKYIQKDKIGTIYVVVLGHWIAMDPLMKGLGFEIERYDAKLIEHKAESRKRGGNFGKKRNKKCMFDMVPYTPSAEAYELDLFLRSNLSLNGDEQTCDLGVIKIYFIEPHHAQSLEIELIRMRDAKTILVQGMSSLHAKEVKKFGHGKQQQVDVISYFEEIDATFEHFLCFLRLLNDKQLSSRELMRWIAASVWNLIRIERLLWDELYARLISNYYNQSMKHNLMLEFIEKCADQLPCSNTSVSDQVATDKLSELEKTPGFLFGDTSRTMMFDMALVALHRVTQIKMEDLKITTMNTSYSQSNQFPRDLWYKYGNYYTKILKSRFIKLRQNFTQQSLQELSHSCYKFEIFKSNFDIGRILYHWKFSKGSVKTSDSVSVVVPEWQITDRMVNIIDVLLKLGYDISNIQLFHAEMIEATTSVKSFFTIERDWRLDNSSKEPKPSNELPLTKTRKQQQQKKKKRKK